MSPRPRHAVYSTDVPLAETTRCIAGLFEEHRHRRLPVRGNAVVVRRAAIGLSPFAQTALPAPGQKCTAGCRTQRSCGIVVGKPHPVARQPIQHRRGDIRLRIEASQIAIAQIIRQKEDNIGGSQSRTGTFRSTLRRRRVSKYWTRDGVESAFGIPKRNYPKGSGNKCNTHQNQSFHKSNFSYLHP